MSSLLAIESSTKILSVALFKDNALLEEEIKNSDGRAHSEVLLPLIDQLLKKNHVSLSPDLKIAITVGPGSYTSLRVGLATALGLARGSGCQLIPVSSLKALASQMVEPDFFLAPLLKAGRGKVYGALFEQKEGCLKTLIHEASYDPTDFISSLKNFSKKICIGGPGCELIQIESQENMIKYLPDLIPQARFVGELVLMENIPSSPPEKIALRYLQAPFT